ncbi:MAG: hypothetical protein Q8P41_03300 [Pseudomonadota bacterium]|nr:hypothetical protein [Pseudomonadota bacterium]
MEPTPAAVAAYESAIPDDPRVERKKMFGAPCSFVNRQMFFGTFEGSVIARVGPARVEALAGQPGMRVFTPMEDRPWRDYVQVDAPVDLDTLKGLAAEALAWAAKLPPKAKKPKTAKRTKKTAATEE